MGYSSIFIPNYYTSLRKEEIFIQAIINYENIYGIAIFVSHLL